jgi:hypothetical protein
MIREEKRNEYLREIKDEQEAKLKEKIKTRTVSKRKKSGKQK